MRKLLEQFEYELSRKKRDDGYLAMIREAICGRGVVFKQFVDSGRVMTRESYDGQAVLHDDAMDVVVYLGGYVMGIRKDDVFFVDGYESRSLDEVEAWLWERVVWKEIGQ